MQPSRGKQAVRQLHGGRMHVGSTNISETRRQDRGVFDPWVAASRGERRTGDPGRGGRLAHAISHLYRPELTVLTTMRTIFRSSLLIRLLLCSARFSLPAWAHSMYQAAVLLDFHGSTADAELQLPVERLQAAMSTQLSSQSIERQRVEITNYILRNFSASVPGGLGFRIDPIDAPRLSSIEGAPYVVARLRLVPPAAPARTCSSYTAAFFSIARRRRLSWSRFAPTGGPAHSRMTRGCWRCSAAAIDLYLSIGERATGGMDSQACSISVCATSRKARNTSCSCWCCCFLRRFCSATPDG